MTGITCSLTYNQVPYSILISNHKNNSEELLRITQGGDIFYRFNGEMIKVNCPDDISNAFLQTVIGYTGQQPDDIMIDKYIQKIINNERSNEYISKLENAFRKIKLKKIKNL